MQTSLGIALVLLGLIVCHFVSFPECERKWFAWWYSEGQLERYFG